jgi:Fe-S-cluster containining protein
MALTAFRPCGDCTACCDGHIMGNSYGNSFGFSKPCAFLVHKLCSIYVDRPSCCSNYQCAWTQGLFSDKLKPNVSGVLISVESTDDKQFLKVVEMREIIDYNIYQEIEDFCKANNTYYIKVTRESNSRDPRL